MTAFVCEHQRSGHGNYLLVVAVRATMLWRMGARGVVVIDGRDVPPAGEPVLERMVSAVAHGLAS